MKIQGLNKISAISLEGISGKLQSCKSWSSGNFQFPNRPSALRGRSARKTGGVLACQLN